MINLKARGTYFCSRVNQVMIKYYGKFDNNSKRKCLPVTAKF